MPLVAEASVFLSLNSPWQKGIFHPFTVFFFFLNEEENHREERHSTEKNVRARDGDPKSEPRWRGGLHQDKPRDGDPRSEPRWLRGLHQDRPRGGGEAEPSCRTFRLWGRHKAMVQQTKAGKCNS